MWWFALGWIICFPIVYFTFRWNWTRKFDFTEKDRKEFLIVSVFGPIALIALVIVLFMTFADYLIDCSINNPKGRVLKKARNPY